jgi:cytochrome oxidase Cu insertion factor (SCO1/SenC/PrrC family)
MLLAGYYVLRPLRDQMAIAGGVKALPWMFTATFVTLLVAQPLYGKLVARLPRRRFIPIVYHFFVANVVLFWLLLTLKVEPVLVARVFFVWVSVFNLFAVTVFWSFMADLFTSEQGKIVSLKEYFNRRTADGKGGRPVVVQMMYYRCPILCPQVLQRLTSTLNEIDLTVGKDFDVLLVSFDPRDTSKDSTEHKSAQLISYNRGSQDTANGWNFLTSSPEAARSLGESLGFPFRALENGEFSHGAALYILTPEGKVSRSLIGLNYPAADVKLAILEASGGKIGTWKDAFVLWCYHFDPDAGTYTVAAMRVMRVGAIITIAFVGSLLLVMWRFEKRKRAARAALAGASSSALSSDSPLPSVRLPGASAPLTGSTP